MKTAGVMYQRFYESFEQMDVYTLAEIIEIAEGFALVIEKGLNV